MHFSEPIQIYWAKELVYIGLKELASIRVVFLWGEVAKFKYQVNHLGFINFATFLGIYLGI